VDSSDRSIARAAEVLRAGGLVAMPTETVYGLAADASSPEAVERVFRAKGRPADHPLIVHLGGDPATDLEQAGWARDVPGDAARLMEAFWPGPLTLVLARHPSVPLAVTGGLDTVAVRMPSHPVARRILDAFGGGLAAPSANRFGRVSPTTAADVVAELGPAVDLVVDGGPCEIGVESTVAEVIADGGGSGPAPEVTVLRPGGLSAEALEEVLGRPVRATATGPSRAPGMLASHYAPRTPLVLCEQEVADERVATLVASGKRVGLIALDATPHSGAHVVWDAGGDVDVLARSLYGWMREADAQSLDVLVAVPPEPVGLGAAVRDRLVRAAHR
jgi:L-threonylcarbamoyladenylate synthase